MIDLYQSDSKGKVWEAKRNYPKTKAPPSSVKHGGVGVMVWACMAATGAVSIAFFDNAAIDSSSIMN